MAFANDRSEPLFDFNLSDVIHRFRLLFLRLSASYGGYFANEIDLHGNTCVTLEIDNEMYSMHFQCAP